MIAIVFAGISLSALVFHVLRVGTALRMRRHPVEPGLVRAHLRGAAGA